ncbi:MAG TPA: transketolase C-terminal domain-containing protein [candidate division Zixibacteria bacterium]|nr:transketolase C-terminal domain-containing protein [candidate division Zixibacteria bacterium]
MTARKAKRTRWLLALLAVWQCAAVYAQEKSKGGADLLAQLYADARKEGTVIIWGPTDAIIYQRAQERLNKQYPGIRIEHFESIPEPLVQRVIAETQAGKPPAVDVIQSGSLRALRPLIDRDMLVAYPGWERSFGLDAVYANQRFVGAYNHIAMPASAGEAYWAFREALSRPTPTLFFEDRSLHSRADEVQEHSPGLRARIARAGERLTIVAAGRAAALAEDAANELAKDGWRDRVEVVSLGFVKPIDREAVLESARKTGRVLIVQDEPPWSGYAPFVRCLLDRLPAGALAAPPRLICGADQFLPFWDERPFLPSLEAVVAAARELAR